MTTTQNEQIMHASEDSFSHLVLESDVPVLVDFFADWCGPCRRMVPVLDELVAESTGLRIVKVDVDECPSLAARYRVDSIPALKVFRNGVVTNQIVGLASKSQLKAMLKS